MCRQLEPQAGLRVWPEAPAPREGRLSNNAEGALLTKKSGAYAERTGTLDTARPLRYLAAASAHRPNPQPRRGRVEGGGFPTTLHDERREKAPGL